MCWGKENSQSHERGMLTCIGEGKTSQSHDRGVLTCIGEGKTVNPMIRGYSLVMGKGKQVNPMIGGAHCSGAGSGANVGTMCNLVPKVSLIAQSPHFRAAPC